MAWRNLGGTPRILAAFARFLTALDPDVFGTVTGAVRVATGTRRSPTIDTWPLAELDGRLTPEHYLVDAKLDLEPTVIAHDGEVELVELTELAQEEWPMDKVPLVQRGSRWAIVGRPSQAEDESLLFIDVDFDAYGEHDALTASFRTKTDIWLAYRLDGEPSGADQRANRELLIAALRRIAEQTHGTLELNELARSP